MDYVFDCKYGADRASTEVAEFRNTGNLPKLKRVIEQAAKDETGFGVGFLTQLCREVMQ